MSVLAFSPLGTTVSFIAATTAPASVQAVSASGRQVSFQYRIVNSGAVLVFLGVGVTDAAARGAAASIDAGAIPLLPSTVEILGFPTSAHFSGRTESGTALVYVTPGTGL